MDTEHLLLGLLQQKRERKNSMAWFEEFDVDLRKVRGQVECMWAPSIHAGEGVGFPFTPSLRRVVEQAQREAR
ncbi:MAG: hypothetical protein M3N33_01150 [Actinomycetota bacterium]|nr:hypothetical protein [Actinomycetota bacterium]